MPCGFTPGSPDRVGSYLISIITFSFSFSLGTSRGAGYANVEGLQLDLYWTFGICKENLEGMIRGKEWQQTGQRSGRAASAAFFCLHR